MRLTVTAAGRQLPGGIGRYPFFPQLKVANFLLLPSVRRTENRINIALNSMYWKILG